MLPSFRPSTATLTCEVPSTWTRPYAPSIGRVKNAPCLKNATAPATVAEPDVWPPPPFNAALMLPDCVKYSASAASDAGAPPPFETVPSYVRAPGSSLAERVNETLFVAPFPADAVV